MSADSHIVEDQSAVADFLADPATHDGAPVERIDTYAAIVFLAGDAVYKVKRAVRYSFMDFSTLEKREAVCRAELTLNRRTAPDLYRRVAAITREADGGLALDGVGQPVEWAVVMRRFDQDGLFDRLAARGALTAEQVRDAVVAAARLHREAEIVRDPPSDAVGGTAAYGGVIAEIADELAERPDLIAPDELRACADAQHAALSQVAPLLDRRRADGMVRRGHGDLHLGNIALVDGRATLFDCIEFNDAIATIDGLFDIAFLLMDLEHRDLGRLANVALNAWVPAAPGGATGTIEALAALPLMLSLRAGIRAMVDSKAGAAQADADERRAHDAAARAYFAAARGFLEPWPPCLVAVGGFSGSGKSTLARALAPDLGRAPGAVLLRSDAIRKELCGVAETEPLPEAAYARAMSDRVYAEMFARARLALQAGQSAIVDGVNSDPAGRADLRKLADEAGAPFTGFWLDAPAETLKARVTARRGDASDADAAVVARQLREDPGPLDWHRLDAGGGSDAVAAAARGLLAGALRHGSVTRVLKN
jgi:aminoglycoside phosphotransferase family enzyme/predicted kinase